MKKREIVELTPRQKQAIAHLLAGNSQRETAKLLNIHENTLSEWAQSAMFQGELRAGQRRILGTVTNRLAESSNAAVAYMATVMSDKAQSVTVRLRAADRLLSHYSTFYGQAVTDADLADLRQRIEELEGEKTR